MAAIALDVVTHVDERRLALDARKIEQQLAASGLLAGEGAGEGFAKSFSEHLASARARSSIESELNKISKYGDTIGQDFAKNMAANLHIDLRQHGERAGESFMGGMVSSFRRSNFDSLGGIFESGEMLARARTSGGLVGAALVGGITVAAGAALTGLAIEIGDKFEEINRGITLSTDASGEALEGLKSRADALVGSLDTSAKSIGSDMGLLATRLQLEAGPALDQLTRHVEELRDRFGSLDTSAFAGAMIEFKVSGAQADDVLASLLKTSREFSVPLPSIVADMGAFASTLAEVGLNAEQAGHLIGVLGQHHVDAKQAIMGLEVAEKAAAKAGEPLPEFIRRAAESMEYYHRIGNETAADQVALDVFGQRRWIQAQKSAQAYLDVLRAGPDAYRANAAGIDPILNQTKTLGNHWQELRNKIETALAPVALDVVEDVSKKMDSFVAWLDGHKEDLKRFFENAIQVIENVVGALGEVAAFLGRHPALIEAVAVAFGTWESLKGISAVLTGVQGIGAALGLLPAEAATAGAGMAAGMAPALAAATAIATALALWNEKGSAAPTNIGPGAGERQQKLEAGKAYAEAHGGQVPPGYAQWLDKGGPLPPGMDQFYHGAAPGTPFFDDQGRPLNAQGQPFGGPGPANSTPYVPGTPSAAPSYAPGAAPGAAPPGVGSSLGNVTPPDHLLTPEELEAKKGPKGPKLPKAPEVPYGAGYGAPPAFGESAQHYSAEQAVLEQRHAVEEARARLNQLESAGVKDADAIQKARNDVLKAQQAENEAELRLSEDEHKRIRKTGDELEQLGAKIDNDFGISKGLPGIAENLTKFLANLAAAPVFGALQGANAAIGGDTHGAKGLLGAAALGGAFGPQFTPAELAAGGGPGGRGGLGSALSKGGLGGLAGALPGDIAAAGAGDVTGTGAQPGGLNLSTVAVAAQQYANDCIDASARIILSHSGVNMTEDQLKGMIAPGGTIESQAAGLNKLDPAGQFTAMAGSGGSPAALFNAVKASIDSGTGSILNVAPGSSIAGRQFSEGHFIAATGYNPDGTINLSDTASGTKYSVSAADAFQATRGRGIVAGTGSGPGAIGGGMPMPGGGDAGGPGAGGPATPPAAGGGGDLNFDALSIPEAGGNWANTSNPKYSGGLQFDQQTWNAYKPPGAPGVAAQASREQQIQAAKNAIAAGRTPQSLWPQNWRQLYSGSAGAGAPGPGGLGPPDIYTAPPGPRSQSDPSKPGYNGPPIPGVTGPPAPQSPLDQLPIGRPPGFAAGGTVGSTDTVPAMLSPGEHVLTRQDVKAMGGQDAVYKFRAALGTTAGTKNGAPKQPEPPKTKAPPPPSAPEPAPPQIGTQPKPGADPMPYMQQLPGGPQPGRSQIGTIAPTPGYGKGFTVTGGGLVGVLESLPAQAANAAIAAASFGAWQGGAVPGYADGGTVSDAVPPAGGGAGGSPGGAGGGGAPGSSVAGALIGIGMQEINEAISKSGQAAGAIVGGLQQTFGPQQFAQSKLAQTGWVSKLVGGITGAHPQLPNTAGPKQAPGGLTPEQAASAGAPPPGGAGGPAGAVHMLHVAGDMNIHGDEAGASQTLSMVTGQQLASHGGTTSALMGTR